MDKGLFFGEVLVFGVSHAKGFVREESSPESEWKHTLYFGQEKVII
jgi:hypothetical protein